MLVQNVNVLHMKIKFPLQGKRTKTFMEALVNQYLLVALVTLNF